jgi:hypothetical protein
MKGRDESTLCHGKEPEESGPSCDLAIFRNGRDVKVGGELNESCKLPCFDVLLNP